MRISALPAAAIIGAGAVGGALASLLDGQIYRFLAVATKHHRSRGRLPVAMHRAARGSHPALFPPDMRVVLIAVPDDEMPGIIKTLASRDDVRWKRVTVLHTSGALSSDACAGLRTLGARCGSMHPLQSFPRSLPLKKRRELMRGIYWGIEGDAAAVREARTIVSFLNGRAIRLKAKDKALYHAACVCASNYIVTLLSMAEEIAELSGIRNDEFRAAVRRLVTRTVENAMARSPQDALTGPIERGDAGTIRKHLEELGRRLPRVVEAYTALGSETIGLALRKGSIDNETAANLYRLLYTR